MNTMHRRLLLCAAISALSTNAMALVAPTATEAPLDASASTNSAPASTVQEVQAPQISAPKGDDEYAQRLNELQKAVSILKIEDQKAKLEESVAATKAKSKTDVPLKLDTLMLPALPPAQPAHEDTRPEVVPPVDEMVVKSIYGNGKDFQATIRYRGIDSSVKPGMALDNNWRVESILSDRVVIRNNAKKTKTLYTTIIPTVPAASQGTSPITSSIPQSFPATNPHGGSPMNPLGGNSMVMPNH